MTDVDGSCLKFQRAMTTLDQAKVMFPGQRMVLQAFTDENELLRRDFVLGETEAITTRDGQRLSWFFYTKCCLLPVAMCGCQNWWARNVLPPMVLQLLCGVAGYR